jgi:crotonobetainyl-CoA:carnitine CoA-transferase CaiB-like acyl-CoA transferase
MADRVVGLNATHAILAALFHRERTGEGQAIEIPMFETMAQFVLGDHMAGRSFEPPVGPPGYSRLLSPDRRPYRTKDGFVCTMIYNDRQWRSFFRVLGMPDLVSTDPRFASHATRTEHIDEILAMLSEIFRERTTAEWLALLAEADLPVTPVHDLESIFEDPHLQATGFFEAEDHPTEGRLTRMAAPMRFSASPTGERLPTPRLGEHSAEILREAGYAEAEVATLFETGAVRAPG